jgi:hypothetical protein
LKVAFSCQYYVEERGGLLLSQVPFQQRY